MTRARLLEALSSGPRTRAELATVLELPLKEIKSTLSNAQQAGQIEGLSSRQGQRGAAEHRQYRITDGGRYVLAGFRAHGRKVNSLRTQKAAPAVPLSKRQLAARAKRLAQYRLDHETHVALQRLLGIPESLIGAKDEDAELAAREAA